LFCLETLTSSNVRLLWVEEKVLTPLLLSLEVGVASLSGSYTPGSVCKTITQRTDEIPGC
jgi:hypothetical protein